MFYIVLIGGMAALAGVVALLRQRKASDSKSGPIRLGLK